MAQANGTGGGVRAGIEREQVQLAMRQLPTMQLVSFVVALVLGFVVRDIVPRTSIIIWLLLVLAVAVSRLLLYIGFQRFRFEPFGPRTWARVYLSLSLASGIIWGASAFLIFPDGRYNLIALFVLVIASLSSATTVSHASLKFGPAAWMTPALLMYAFRCFLDAGEIGYTTGTLIILYYFTLLFYSLNHHKTITESIILRFDKMTLQEDANRSAEQFRLLFQNHAAVMLLTDPESGRIVDANASAERLYGYPAGRLKQMRVSDITMLPAGEVRSIQESALRGDLNRHVQPYRIANGDIRTMEVHTSPIQTGDRVLLFSIIQDITERRRAEERLRESEANYRNLFNSMRDAVSILDEHGMVLDVNQGAEDMYGRSRNFFLDKPLESLAAPGRNDPGVVGEAVRQAFHGKSQLIDFEGVRADGVSFPQELRLMPATYAGRRVVIAVARDVSERRRAEAELLRAQKLEAIGVLAGGIAHDFNNLLQSIFGFLAVARKRIDDRDKALLMLDKADKALKATVNLTGQLLTFSRGGKPIMRSISLGAVIESSVRFALSGSRSIGRLTVAGDLWPIEADEGQIGQVLQNIVLNADQAMPNGGQITIVARNADRGTDPLSTAPGTGRWVEISIADSGVGILPENQARIFEPYFTTKQHGSGLGLATSYSIMKNHGGMIELSSRPGEGSIFTLWLPAGAHVVQPGVNIACVEPPQRQRILVMDDDDTVRESIGEMLGMLGQEVEFSIDGTSAIERYRGAKEKGNPFSVVILDATIRGGMGGAETMARLLELDPSVTAVIASGYSDGAAVANYERHGFRAVLLKPFSLESLQSVLSSLMPPDADALNTRTA
jgi:two-component system cell cycle sensor histidine kinase/response regulator CckA